jgi:hypothetical protein
MKFLKWLQDWAFEKEKNVTARNGLWVEVDKYCQRTMYPSNGERYPTVWMGP